MTSPAIYTSVVYRHKQHAPATIHGVRHLADTAEAEAYLNDVAARLRTANITTATHVHAIGVMAVSL